MTAPRRHSPVAVRRPARAAIYGGEHAHREVLLVEADSALRRRAAITARSCTSCSRPFATPTHDLGDRATLLQADTYTDALERYGRPVLVHEPTSHAAEKFVHRLHDRRPASPTSCPTPTFALPRKDFARVGRRSHPLPHGGLLPRPAPPLRRADGRRRTCRRPLELRRRQPRTTTEETGSARCSEAVPAARGRHRRAGPARSRPDEPRHRRRRRPAAVRRHPHRGEACARPLHRTSPARASAATRTPSWVEDWAMSHSLLSVPLNLGVLHPLDAVEAAEHAYRGGTHRSPQSRASSARSSAGANTCGTCTGTSVPTTRATTSWRARTALPNWWTRPRRRRRHRRMPAPRA